MRETFLAPRRKACSYRKPWRAFGVWILLFFGFCWKTGGVEAAMDKRREVPAELLERWEPRPIRDLRDVGAGDLLWRTDDGLVPLPLAQTDVRLDVTGILVHATVTQLFANPTGKVIEAIYVFPLPDRAAVHHMEMWIGERRIVSRLKERGEARKTYRRAKRLGHKAALLDQERPNLFTTAVANINPGESIQVTMEMLDEVEFRDGLFRYSFPLTFTPRFATGDAGSEDAGVSGGESDAGRSSAPFGRFTDGPGPLAVIDARIDAGLDLLGVESPSHPIRAFSHGKVWRVEPLSGAITADHDFILQWRPKYGQEPAAAIFTEKLGESRYALLMMVPPSPEGGPPTGLPTETVFIVDVSGSMGGPSIRQARQALLAALDRLGPEDRFNLLQFNENTDAFADRFLPATEEALNQARAWVQLLEAGGGTRILPALMRGLAMTRNGNRDNVQRIIFLTDGAVDNESRIFDTVIRKLGPVRLHTIGIGNAPNRYLMRKMAKFGRGLSEFVATTEGAENQIDRFYARLRRPVMTNLELDWEGIEPEEIYPARLPDLYAGEPLVLSLKLPVKPLSGRVVLRGRTKQGEVSLRLEVSPDGPKQSGIGTRWGRAKIESLMNSLHEGADGAEVRAAVIEVATEFNLVTKYTSLVAVENVATAEGPAVSRQVSNTLPTGSRLQGPGLPRGGTTGPLYVRIGLLLSLLGLALAGLSRRLSHG